MKFCKECKCEKEEDFFPIKRNVCKECVSIKRSEYYKLNKEKEDYRSREYRLSNEESIKTSKKRYYAKNNDKVKEKSRSYYNENKTKISERRKKKYREDSDKVKNNVNEYRISNPEKIKSRKKKYYQSHKQKIRDYQKVWDKNKLNSDPVYRMKRNISNLIRISFKSYNYSKISKTEFILGCSYKDFRLYIESKFEPWMNWNNYGLYDGELCTGWDLDHIVPISSATAEEEVISLNYYTNFQPLCSKINRDIKRNKIISDNLILDSNLNDIPEYLDTKCS